MPVIRGSTGTLYTIPEVTFGTTPATPALVEVPFVSFGPRHNHTTIRSETIRSHPFVDRVMNGRNMHELALEVEAAAVNYDKILENTFGSVISSKAMKYLDALKGMSFEHAKGGGSSLFDQYAGVYWNRVDFSSSANDTAPVKLTFGGMAKTGNLDESATISGSLVAADTADPYIAADSELQLDGAGSEDIVSGTFSIERQVDPLMIWGSREPREFIPGQVSATGTIVVPYDDAVYSGHYEAFADHTLRYKVGAPSFTTFRAFLFHQIRFTGLGRQINTRGGTMQEVNWEAMYNTAQATICTVSTQ